MDPDGSCDHYLPLAKFKQLDAAAGNRTAAMKLATDALNDYGLKCSAYKKNPSQVGPTYSDYVASAKDLEAKSKAFYQANEKALKPLQDFIALYDPKGTDACLGRLKFFEAVVMHGSMDAKSSPAVPECK